MAEAATPIAKIATNIEEAANAMAARAEVDGDDFRVKIMRRASPASPNESIAIFDGATMEMLLSPEPWLVKFAGGSLHYTFRVVHAKDRTVDRPLAFYQLPAIPGAPTAPNIKIVGSPGWTGPSALLYPEEKDATITTPGGSSPDRKRQTGDSTSPSAGDGGAGSSSSLLAEIQRERERVAEERHRMEVEAIRRASEDDRKRLEARFGEVLAELRAVRERPVEPPRSIEDILKAVAAVATPIVAAVVPLIAEGKRAAQAQLTAREEREARRDEERQKRESSLMEKIASQSSDTAKVISVFTDSLAQTARAMVQTVAMVGELRPQPEEDNSLAGLAKAAIAAWVETTAARAQPQAPMLPAAQPQPAPPPPRAPVAPSPIPGVQPAGDAEGEVTGAQMIDIFAQEVSSYADVNDLASGFIDAATEPEFVAAIQGEGGVVPALQKRIGTPGDPPRFSAYVSSLFNTIGEMAKARGMDLRPLFPGHPAA